MYGPHKDSFAMAGTEPLTKASQPISMIATNGACVAENGVVKKKGLVRYSDNLRAIVDDPRGISAGHGHIVAASELCE